MLARSGLFPLNIDAFFSDHWSLTWSRGKWNMEIDQRPIELEFVLILMFKSETRHGRHVEDWRHSVGGTNLTCSSKVGLLFYIKVSHVITQLQAKPIQFNRLLSTLILLSLLLTLLITSSLLTLTLLLLLLVASLLLLLLYLYCSYYYTYYYYYY